MKEKIAVSAGKTAVIRLDNATNAITVVIEQNACATIIENTENSALERTILLTAHSGSRVDYLTLVKNGNVKKYAFTANLKKNSRITWHFFGRTDTNCDIRGILNHKEPGTTGNIIAALDARGDKTSILNLTNNHEAPHTTGDMAFRGLGREAARAEVNGLIKIGLRAPFTNSYLDEKVLLISDKARVSAEPNLEILNNEVSASHSATIGNLDPNALHYMESRGIDKKTAENMLITGFFKPLIMQIGNKHIKKALQNFQT